MENYKLLEGIMDYVAEKKNADQDILPKCFRKIHNCLASRGTIPSLAVAQVMNFLSEYLAIFAQNIETEALQDMDDKAKLHKRLACMLFAIVELENQIQGESVKCNSEKEAEKTITDSPGDAIATLFSYLQWKIGDEGTEMLKDLTKMELSYTKRVIAWTIN